MATESLSRRMSSSAAVAAGLARPDSTRADNGQLVPGKLSSARVVALLSRSSKSHNDLLSSEASPSSPSPGSSSSVRPSVRQSRPASRHHRAWSAPQAQKRKLTSPEAMRRRVASSPRPSRSQLGKLAFVFSPLGLLAGAASSARASVSFHIACVSRWSR